MDKLGFLVSLSSQRGANATEGTRFYRLLRVLEKSPAVSYILDSNHRLVYTNPAWDKFAISNGAPRLAGEAMVGYNIFDAIADVLRPVYNDGFRRATETEGGWAKTYTCSSPQKVRKFKMQIYFMERRNWFLVTNSLLVQRPHRKFLDADHDAYFQRGIVTMCAHCRCSKRMDGSNLWDFVPEYLRLKGLEALNVSQGLCPVCQEHFYPYLAPA